MDEVEKLKQQREAISRKLASVIAARKKAWSDGKEKRLAMIGAWALHSSGIDLDAGLESMPPQFVASLTEKQKAVWAKPWEKKATETPVTEQKETPAPAPRIETTATALNVDYTEKDAAKALGAVWNATAMNEATGKPGAWEVPAGVDLRPFAKWL